MIKELASRKIWSDEELICQIYIRENNWESLLKYISQKPYLEQIEKCEKYLSKDYAQELSLLYEGCILKYVRKNVGRGYYQTACRYLRRMTKLGAKERVKDIIKTFRKEYPQRRALMQELDKV